MSSKHKTVTERVPGQDAIEQLMADHKRVAKLFSEFETLKDNGSDDAKSALVAQICRELTVHTAIEEEIFYPAVRKAIDDEGLMDEAVVEHAGAKELIAQLQAANPDDALYDAKVTVLGEQIDHHVEEEEGSMFPQTRASGIDTLSIGAALLERRADLLANLRTPSAMRIGVTDSNVAKNDPRSDFSDRKTAKLKRTSAPSKRPPGPAVKKKTPKQKPSKKKR